LFLRLTIQIIVFLATLVSPVLGVLSAHAGCSTYRSPQKVWFNEYFFGVGANNPPNFLELYTTSPAFQTQWAQGPGSTVEVYSAANTKKTYTFTSTTATACTIGNKTWITANVLGSLESNQALVILRDPSGDAIDAFVFDNQAPPAPWQSATVNWAPGHTTGCAALDTALSDQAAAATQPSKQTNMLILQNYGNKDLARIPDGGSIWDVTSNTGSGTTYTQCVSNNANLAKTVDYFSPSPGNTITFTLSIANTGNSALTGITLDDFLPDYTYAGSVAPTYVSAIPVNPSDLVTTASYTTEDPNLNGTPTDTTATKITWTPAAIAAGTTAKLNIKMQLPNTAVPGYFYKNIAQTTGGLTPNQSDFVDFTVGSQNVGSFVITVNPATASTCTPAHLGPQVTITAMTGPNGTGNVDPAYTGEDSSGNSVVYLTASSANLTWHDSSYTPITVSPAPENSFVDGVATFFLTGSTAETISVSALDTSSYTPNLMQGASGSITFTSGSGGVVLTDADTTLDRNSTPIYGVVAGRPHMVRATISQCGEPATGKTGQYSVTFRYTAGLNHPAGATPPDISTTASCSAPITLSTGTGTAITLTFNSGVSDFYLCTEDVGQFALNLSLTLPNPGGGTFTGTSGNFTVRPFVITASNFAGTITNPKGSLPTDGVFTSAGTPFSGTFDAWKWRSLDEDSNNDGIPNSDITAAAFSPTDRLPRFSGTTNNAGVITFAPKLNTPVGGVSGGFLSPSPSPAIASSGTVTLSTFTSSEVGSITIGGVDPAGSYGATNYLGMSGLHVPILSDVIGRFVPHHFTVTAAVANACPAGSITYMGQPFTFSQPGVVEARNAGEVITQNYRDDGVAANDYAPGTVNFGAENADNGTDLSGRLAFYSAATYPALTGSWAGGVYTLTGNDTAAAFTRPTAIVPDSTWGSFDSLDLGLTVIDNDVATSPRVSGADMNPATTGSASLTYKKFSGGPLRMRYGRLVLQNAFGPETENHRMRLLAQYYNVDAFVANAEDTCSNYNAASLTCGNLIGPVACGDVTVGGANISHGQFFTLSAPNKIGTLLYTLTVAPWLLYEWDGAGNDFNENPFARANFGIYRGNDRIINWREIIR
jgi:uncharacterized repeat protein (TIGR01451 family)